MLKNIIFGVALLWLLCLQGCKADPPCGGSLAVPVGSVQSPSYPHSYHSQNCTWTLKTVTQAYIQLVDFHISVGDTLSIYNSSVTDNTTLVKTFTGQTDFELVYVKVSTNATVITIVFTVGSKSVPKTWTRRFQFKYNTKMCLVSGRELGTIKGPNYVVGPGLFQCTYHLDVFDDDYALSLTFSKVNLVKGNLTIKDGNATSNKTLGKYKDGTTSIGDVISTLTEMTLEYNLDTTVSQPDSFTAVYTAVTKACSGMMKLTDKLTLHSPSYPSHYTQNLKCRWLVTANSTAMLASFDNLVLGDPYDHVALVDGNTMAANLIGMFNKDPGNPFLTSGNAIMVDFTTNEMKSERGFALTLEVQDRSKAIYNRGSFDLSDKQPNATWEMEDDPPTNASLISYQLVASPDCQVYLLFTPDPQISPPTVVRCYEGLVPNDSLLLAQFDNSSGFHPVFSNGDHMLVQIQGFYDASHNTTAVTQTLNASFLSIQKADGDYRNYLDRQGADTLTRVADAEEVWEATWLIHNHQPGDTVALKLHSVNPGVNSSVRVNQGLSDQGPLLANFTSPAADLPIIYTNQARIYYATHHTNGSLDDDIVQLISMSYEVIPVCSVNVTAASGRISSPYYPNQYPLNANCSWMIPIPPLKQLHVSFDAFSLAGDHSVRIVSKRTIHKGNSTENETVDVYTTLGMYAGMSLPPDVIATGDELIVVMSSLYNGTVPAVSQGFAASYQTLEFGVNATNSSGSVGTPAYPALPASPSTGVWVINLPHNGTKKGSVNIVSFTYKADHFTNSSSQKFEIRDGPSASSKLLFVNLTASESKPVLSRTNALWVWYSVSDSGEDGNKTNSFAVEITYSAHECTTLCDNGICLHDDWKCNAHDNCGDGTDERGCTYNNTTTGYPGWVLAVAIILTLLGGVLLTLLIQKLIHRYRSPPYNHLRDIMDSAPT